MHESLKPLDDTHGTTHRETMKTILEKPAGKTDWKPYNRLERRSVMSFVVGWLVIAVVFAVAVSQVAIRHGWRP